jgi:hypothetical protein
MVLQLSRQLQQEFGNRFSEKSLRSIYAKLSHADHPLRRNCDRVATLEVVRLIEGKA